MLLKAVPYLRRLVAGFSPRMPGFAPRAAHVGFVVDKVALGQIFLRILRSSPVNIIPPLFHIHSYIWGMGNGLAAAVPQRYSPPRNNNK
jgi:hypothetical protein